MTEATPAPVVELDAAEHIRVNAVERYAATDTPAVIRSRQRALAAAAYTAPQEEP